MTTAFWISAAGLVALTLTALLVPMMRKRAPGDESARREDFDITVYKDQLTEVDRDVARGVLSEDQALAARTEIERRMLAVAGPENGAVGASVPDDAQTRPRVTGAMIAAMLVVIPLGAAALYWSLGNPGLPDQPLAERRTNQDTQTADQPRSADERMAQLRAMIQEMEKRAEQEPDNPQVWNTLGQIRQMMMDHDGAVAAFRKLVEVTDRHPEALIALAEALFMQADETVTAESKALFEESRAAEPRNPMAYYYLALEREQADDAQGAMDEYAALLSVSPEDGEWVPDIQARMDALAGEAGIEVPVVEMLPPMNPQGQGAGPTQEQVQQAQEMSPEEQQAMIVSMVERLAKRLEENPDDLAGWQRLAQAYRVLGDEEGLAEAQAQIERLSGQ